LPDAGLRRPLEFDRDGWRSLIGASLDGDARREVFGSVENLRRSCVFVPAASQRPLTDADRV
jgi:hypothetical protein